MSEAEIADTDPAIGLGCALESFIEYEEVKGKPFQLIKILHDPSYGLKS